MLSTMANNEYTVSWNIGTFGHLLKAIIGVQKYRIILDPQGMDCHYPESSLHSFIDIIHPHDDKKVSNKTIKPYFSAPELRFFPLYLNYLKWDNLEEQVDINDFVKTYWNHSDGPSEKCFNIDMTNFLTDTGQFIADMEEFLQEKLNANTIDLIQSKKEANYILYLRYKQIVKKGPAGTDLRPLERAVYICANANGDYGEVLKNIDG